VKNSNNSLLVLMQKSSSNYDGRSINKSQNNVILLVFQILKIRNIRFCRKFNS